MKNFEFVTLFGSQAKKHLLDLAQLRITIFSEYPYLYQGSLEYEQEYLSRYFASDDSCVQLVLERGTQRLVGAATGMPLSQESASFREAYTQWGLSIEGRFYMGEYLLLASYRGLGAGSQLLYKMMNVARETSFHTFCFCAVLRSSNHPKKPKDYFDPAEHWTKLGFQKLEGVIAHFPWQEIGQSSEELHPMQFWERSLKDT